MWIDKPEEQNQSQAAPLENPTIGSGGGTGATVQSSTDTTGNASSLSPAPQGQKQKPATIQDYFKGSKTQGEALGNQITNRLDQTKNQQQQQIGQAASGALGDVSKGVVGFDEGLVSKAVTDPTKVAGDEGEYNKFLQQWDASYKGPDTFEQTAHYDKAAQAAEAAKQKAAQLGSTGGRQQLIQDEFKVYGQGNKGLDEALLQQSSHFGKVGEQAKELGSLQDYLQTKSSEVQEKAKEAKATTEQTKQKTQEALLGEQGAVKQFKSDIDARTTQEQAQAKKAIEDLQKAVESKSDLSDEQLKMLGTTRQEYKDLIQQADTIVNPVSLKEYLTAQNPSAKISRETIAGKQDIAKDEALAKLTGGSKLLGSPQTKDKLVDFDKDQALQDYLNSINADKATRDAARLERERAIAEENARKDEEKTAERVGMQNKVLGNAVLPGVDLVAPGIAGTIGGKLSEVISKDKTASKAVAAVDKNVTQPVVNAVKSVSKAIKKAFCFDGETMIDMIDGSQKAIKDIQLGDRTAGGLVESVRQSITAAGTRYNYRNIVVTGSHAVKEDKWRRIQDSKYARPIFGAGKVYSLVTSNHRVFINSLEFADEHETDNYETLTMEQSLAELNRPKKIVLEVR